MLTEEKIKELIQDFLDIAKKSGVALTNSDIESCIWGCPHSQPKKLPIGKMAVYVFDFENGCLKVGKVGPNSQARYTSHHYNPASSGSNLSRSLVNDPYLSASNALNVENIGLWVKENTYRVDFLIDAKLGMPVLNLLEAFLQCRLRPRYEGFHSQA
jgi:hypothetical protein